MGFDQRSDQADQIMGDLCNDILEGAYDAYLEPLLEAAHSRKRELRHVPLSGSQRPCTSD